MSAAAISPIQYIQAFKKFVLDECADALEVLLLKDDASCYYSFEIRIVDLYQHNVRLATDLLQNPLEILSYAKAAVHEAEAQVILVHENRLLMSLKAYVNPRLCMLPHSLFKPTISSIRSVDVGKPIAICGTVVRTGMLRTLEGERDYECTKCKGVFRVKCDPEMRHEIPKPTKCLASTDDECPGNKFTVVENSQACWDFQEVKIQEQVTRLAVGSIPRSILVILEADMADKCKAGDEVLVSGVMIRRWKAMQIGERCDVEVAILGHHVQLAAHKGSGLPMSDELVTEIRDFWLQHKETPLAGRDIILRSLCPQLFGMFVIKLAMCLVLIGGVQRQSGSTKIRGEPHLLLIGDPGTGKSQLLKYAYKVSPRAVLTTGVGTTNAGLTCCAVRDGAEWMLEAGALVLADGGICCIDEFDSIREHDQTAVHEAMEQQTISVAKAGLVTKLQARTTVLAALNPKGNYDPDQSMSVNCSLASPLLSRFDLVLVLRDTQADNWDETITRFILDGHVQSQNNKPEERAWSIEKMQAYVSYLKHNVKPEVGEDSKKVLIAYYQRQRSADQRNAARTTIRLLESLIRIAEAHARLMFRNQVTVQDALMSVLLMDQSTHTNSLIVAGDSVHSNFSETPDADYLALQHAVLVKLGFDDSQLVHAPLSDGASQALISSPPRQRRTVTHRTTTDLLLPDNEMDNQSATFPPPPPQQPLHRQSIGTAPPPPPPPRVLQRGHVTTDTPQPQRRATTAVTPVQLRAAVSPAGGRFSVAPPAPAKPQILRNPVQRTTAGRDDVNLLDINDDISMSPPPAPSPLDPILVSQSSEQLLNRRPVHVAMTRVVVRKPAN
eukprot:TRINITY_DN10350_c0_g1_i1.p1 TRINITY_DN10350_c0_g1~~TRINITY_DN10350_c0_g1_i1.p1  ORF type:complete len:838 (+),score=157.93 TRINITY_DN10350_c0_g1_i1:45-2558(+)